MKRGDKITVVLRDLRFPGDPLGTTFTIRQGRVRSHRGGRVIFDWREVTPALCGFNPIGSTETVAYSARGIKWARGWEGEEVEALKVAVALR